MRRILLGAVIAGAIAGPGLAADLPAAMPTKAPAYVPAFSWTGTYVGLNVGGLWGRFDDSPTTFSSLTGITVVDPSFSTNASSIVGGIQAGYNWQVSNWVLGFEQDAQFSNLNFSNTFVTAPIIPVPPGGLVAGDGFSSKLKYLAATRAKIGYAWDRVMLYATGGVETGVVDTTGNFVGFAAPVAVVPTSFTDKNKFHVGWTAGVGLEYAMTNNIFLGIDYRYFDLGSETYNLGVSTSAGSIAAVSVSERIKANEVLARINIKLNGLGFFGM